MGIILSPPMDCHLDVVEELVCPYDPVTYADPILHYSHAQVTGHISGTRQRAIHISAKKSKKLLVRNEQ